MARTRVRRCCRQCGRGGASRSPDSRRISEHRGFGAFVTEQAPGPALGSLSSRTTSKSEPETDIRLCVRIGVVEVEAHQPGAVLARASPVPLPLRDWASDRPLPGDRCGGRSSIACARRTEARAVASLGRSGTGGVRLPPVYTGRFLGRLLPDVRRPVELGKPARRPLLEGSVQLCVCRPLAEAGQGLRVSASTGSGRPRCAAAGMCARDCRRSVVRLVRERAEGRERSTRRMR